MKELPLYPTLAALAASVVFLGFAVLSFMRLARAIRESLSFWAADPVARTFGAVQFYSVFLFTAHFSSAPEWSLVRSQLKQSGFWAFLAIVVLAASRAGFTKWLGEAFERVAI